MKIQTTTALWLLVAVWATPSPADQAAPASPAAQTPVTPPSTSAVPPPASPSATPPGWLPDNRLTLSGDIATLTGTHGGDGGSASYLYEPNAHTVLGAAAEYQKLFDAHWDFGSLSAAFSHALTADTLWSVHGEAHEGGGSSDNRHFDYSIVAAGAGITFPVGLSTDLEERQIDVDTTHGSLPKITLAKPWGTHWLTAVAYAHSTGGNLDTQYSLGRIDFYGPGFNLLAGGSVGQVSPAVLDIDGVLETPARHLTEVFAGVTKPLGHVDVALLADNIDLAGIEHFTLTLTVTVHLQ